MKILLISSERALLVSVVLMVLLSQVCHAWRPQGRFGKRQEESPDNHINTESSLLGHKSSQASEQFQDPDVQIFQYEDLVCIKKARTIYKCLQVRSDSDDRE